MTGRKTSKSGGGDVVIERVMSSDTFLSREIRKAPMRKTDSTSCSARLLRHGEHQFAAAVRERGPNAGQVQQARLLPRIGIG